MGAQILRSAARVAAFLFVALIVFVQTLYPQTLPEQTNQRFRTGVEIIRLDVTALGEDGRPLTDLTASDFDVKIDGMPREVRFVRRTGVATGSAAMGAPATVFPGSYATNSRVASARMLSITNAVSPCAFGGISTRSSPR